MKKKFRYLIAAILVFACCPFAVACGETETPEIDYGTLTIANITLEADGTADINPVFSKEEGRGEITYTFDGDDISIADGKVTALKPDTTTTVTAKTAHHEVTFTVTVKAVNYGALVIKSITLEADGTADINPIFTKEEGRGEITYTFEGDNISIADGKVTALKPDTTTTVTAKTAHHEVTFTVTVKAIDYGTLTIVAPAIYANYPAKPLDITFSKPDRAEEITYTVQTEYADTVKIENGKIYAIGTGFSTNKEVRVAAKTAHHTATFAVQVSEFNGANANGNSLNFETRIKNFLADYENRGMTDGGVLFVGDSFFDTGSFWTNFYTTYARKNAFSVGISSSTTTDWDILADRLVYPLAPESIVFHCGTNNIFDDGKNAAGATADIKKTLESFHKNLPNAKIYYFGIEPRNYTHNGNAYAKECNTQIQSYANGKDWLVYLDSPAFCYNADGSLKTSFFRDTVHPKLENYSLYVDALAGAGLTLKPSAAAQNTTIKDIVTTSSQSIGSGNVTDIIYRGLSLRKEFVLTGKLDITVTAANPHMQFKFGDNLRMLVWDGENWKGNGKIGLGWQDVGGYNNDDDDLFPYTQGTKITIPFKLAITSKNVYFYFGKEEHGAITYTLNTVYKNVSAFTNLSYGTESMSAKAYDLVAKTKADDETEYTALVTGEEFNFYEAQGGADGLYVTAPSGSGYVRDSARASSYLNTANDVIMKGVPNGDADYTGITRDWRVVSGGTDMFTGNFALTYKFRVLGKNLEEITAPSSSNISTNNYFHYVGFSKTSSVNTWQYFMFYIKNNDSSANIGNSFGFVNGAGLNKAANVSTTVVEVEVVLVRSGNTVYLAMQNGTDGAWVVSDATVTETSLSVWVGAENLNCKISNFNFSQEASAVTAALTTIGANA